MILMRRTLIGRGESISERDLDFLVEQVGEALEKVLDELGLKDSHGCQEGSIVVEIIKN